MKRDLWSKELRDQIILENGSVQNIEGFPEDLKDVFKTVWETSQKTVIDMAADRAPFIDQTQSMNLWLATPTFGKVNSMHMYAWKKGLKNRDVLPEKPLCCRCCQSDRLIREKSKRILCKRGTI